MKTKILSLSLLLLCAHNAFCCFTTTTYEINEPYGIITCTRGDYRINQHKIWYINIGEPKKVRLKIYMETKPNDDKLFVYTEPLGLNPDLPSYYSHMINGWPFLGGFYRGEVTTTIPSGACVIHFNPSGGNGSSYSGIRIEFSAAPDDDIEVTESSSKILGSQFVMGKLGIGTDAPVVPLHINEFSPLRGSIGSYVPLTRIQGTSMSTSGSKAILIDEFLYQNGSYPGYTQGASIDNTSATPQTMPSWINYTPQTKSVSLGSETQTLLEAKALIAVDSLSQGEVSIGKHVSKTGYGPLRTNARLYPKL